MNDARYIRIRIRIVRIRRIVVFWPAQQEAPAAELSDRKARTGGKCGRCRRPSGTGRRPGSAAVIVATAVVVVVAVAAAARIFLIIVEGGHGRSWLEASETRFTR